MQPGPGTFSQIVVSYIHIKSLMQIRILIRSISGLLSEPTDYTCYVSYHQVAAGVWALEHGVSVVICDGKEDRALLNIVKGKSIGTFFTHAQSSHSPVEVEAMLGTSISSLIYSDQ